VGMGVGLRVKGLGFTSPLTHHIPHVEIIQEQLLRRNVNRFRLGLVFEAHRLLYHST